MLLDYAGQNTLYERAVVSICKTKSVYYDQAVYLCDMSKL